MTRTPTDRRTFARRRRAAPALLGVLTLVGALAACAPMNESNGLLGAEPGALPDLEGPAPAGGGHTSVSSATIGTGGPTLQGLDRRHWPTIVVRVPPGQVEHQPVYFERLHLAKGPARNEGVAPTTATVLEGPSDGGSLLLEAGAAPFVFAGELVLLPLRAVLDPPWSVKRAPEALPGPPMAPDVADWRWVEGTR